MPISIILLGVSIICFNFNIGTKFLKQFPISIFTVNLLFTLFFLLLFIKPINLSNTIYISIGGLGFTLLAIYFLIFKQKKEEVKKITSQFILFFIGIFVLQILMPYLEKDLFDFSILFIGVILGIFGYIISKELTNVYNIIFTTLPVTNILWFILKEAHLPYEVLLLGTGNIFEISMISFITAFVFSIMFKSVSTFFKFKNISFKKQKGDIV